VAICKDRPVFLRDRLSRRLQQLVRDGERDVWRLANGAIADVRRQLAAA
jgi:predicted transcriptional regulator